MVTEQETTNAEGLVVIPDAEYDTYASRGYSTELLPQRPEERTWGVLNYATLWMGPIHNILSYFTVVGFFALGLSAVQVIAAILTALSTLIQ